MCNSSTEGKDFTREYVIKQLVGIDRPKILDIGTGQGTYHTLLASHIPQAYWTGIEAYAPYIQRFNLRDKYNELYNIDARQFQPDTQYDITFCGDVLEHMTKDEAVALVKTLTPHTSHLIISIPIRKWPQHADENPWQEHIKDDWTRQEVIETFPDIVIQHIGPSIGVFIIQNLSAEKPKDPANTPADIL